MVAPAPALAVHSREVRDYADLSFARTGSDVHGSVDEAANTLHPLQEN